MISICCTTTNTVHQNHNTNSDSRLLLSNQASGQQCRATTTAAAIETIKEEMMSSQQQQIHQLELHLQQQHIHHHQHQQQHQQQQHLLQLQLQQQQQHRSQTHQRLQLQALQEQPQLRTWSSTPLQQLQMQTAPPPTSTTSATTTTAPQQQHQQQQQQAIYYTQHYYPTTNQQHLSTPTTASLSPEHKTSGNYSSANNYHHHHHHHHQQQQQQPARLDQQRHHFIAPQPAFDPYCIPSNTNTNYLQAVNPTTGNTYQQHTSSSYKQQPRNSAVYRHQSFQPFYATIQQSSNNYHLYQQHRQSSQNNSQQQQLSSADSSKAAAAAALMSPDIQATTPLAPSNGILAGPRLIWLLFMHRHGDRTPLNMAPRDKYNNVMYWPEGFGNLDNAGRQRMYKLGKFIRRRYEDFLTDNIREIYSRSSDVDRCIESSHAVLAGLYPPSERFEWNKELRWVPAPVHTVPAPEDYLLNEAGRKFLVEVINEINLIQQSDAVKQLYADSVRERELMERELGYEYDMFWKFKATYSTLDIEERNGLEMPAWYTPELKEKLYRFAGIAFGLAGGGTEKLKKLRCGHLLNDIVSRMEMAPVEGPKMRDQSDFMQPTNAPTEVDDRRIVHYSTHDSIMAAFLEALNINTPMPIPPGFGATFFVELYVDLDEQGLPASEKYIKLFYMDDTGSEKPVEKKLPNCKLNEKGQLTLNNFRAYIGHLLSNGSNACNNNL